MAYFINVLSLCAKKSSLVCLYRCGICFPVSSVKYDYYDFVDCASNGVFASYMTAVSHSNDPAQKHLCRVHPDILFLFRIAKMQFPICKIVFTDVTAALLHPCPSVKPSNVYSGECWWNKIKFQIEKDEKQRADFAF